ncbi:type VI secretion system lipoprotein TssJ [Mixta theicola]|uniref:Type VI secretion system lipoprotein TssJ n=1 Tax=Mixta theicola TaxID=1458355 RepID=A0A2K1Q540_9GAMM|nr:type VI secretion system lipoprotein TssJ [Mixta theicola]PNS10121.1 type VI secretion system lipoprotein TssJ [Mixta theicola]GLR08525.1 type VI secretion system protein VasD [Mixta theicola]
MKPLFFLRLSMQALFLAALTLLAGCTLFSHSDPSRYSLLFQAHPPINESAPLKVRVLLLKSDADFMSADFYSLQNSAQTVLGSNLLNSEQFFLLPGQLNKTLSGQRTPDIRYIGVMAEYQALNGKKWRLSLPLPNADESAPTVGWYRESDALQARIVADNSGIHLASKAESTPE